MKTITSRHNPMVSAFREIADEPDPSGRRVLLDGAHLVREALDADLEFEVAVVAESKLAHNGEAGALVDALRARRVEVISVSEPVLEAMSPVHAPSGLVAIARRAGLTAPALFANHHGVIVAAVDVQDPGNLGSLIRACDAAEAAGVMACGASANPFGWKALRGSMGSALRLPTVGGVSAFDAIAAATAAASRVIAAVPRGGYAPEDLDWTRACTLFLGSEGAGLPADIVAAADVRVTIPMNPRVESLNVAVAGALLVYAARRQRQ